MSSYWAGYSGIGMILNETEVIQFLHQYNMCHNTNFDIDDMPFEEPLKAGRIVPNPGASTINPEDATTHASIFHMTHLSQDDCEGITFIPYRKPNGAINVQDEHSYFQLMLHDTYIIFSTYRPSGPLSIEFTPYHGYQDICMEFKNKCQTYLPKDFDWDAHIGEIWYAAYA